MTRKTKIGVKWLSWFSTAVLFALLILMGTTVHAQGKISDKELKQVEQDIALIVGNTGRTAGYTEIDITKRTNDQLLYTVLLINMNFKLLSQDRIISYTDYETVQNLLTYYKKCIDGLNERKAWKDGEYNALVMNYMELSAELQNKPKR
jgi:hypothetical protein